MRVGLARWFLCRAGLQGLCSWRIGACNVTFKAQLHGYLWAFQDLWRRLTSEYGRESS